MKIITFCLLLIVSQQARSQNKTPLAITIDDLPGLNYEMNQKMVSALKTNNWPATAFVNESGFFKEDAIDLTKYEILNLWLSNGLELGNHTYSHIDYHSTDTLDYFADILKGEELTAPLSQQYNIPYRYFRHPYLRNGQTKQKKEALNKFLTFNGYEVAPVTIDNSEWIYAAAYQLAIDKNNLQMANRIGSAYITYIVAISNYFRNQAKELLGRDLSHILLIHVRSLNADLLPELITALEDENFEISPLETVLEDPAYQLKDGYYGSAGISWIERWAMDRDMAKTFFEGIPKCDQFVQDYSGITE